MDSSDRLLPQSWWKPARSKNTGTIRRSHQNERKFQANVARYQRPRREGTWVWDSDGAPVDLNRFWRANQPNGVPESDEDFMVLDQQNELNDVTIQLRPFACTIN